MMGGVAGRWGWRCLSWAGRCGVVVVEDFFRGGLVAAATVWGGGDGGTVVATARFLEGG